MVMIIDGKTPEEIAVEELARKMKKERRFAREMRKQLNDINSDSVAQYRRDGTILNLDELKNDVRKVLRDNYRSIANEFKKSIRKSVGIKQDVDAEIDAELSRYILSESDVVAVQIIKTSQKETEKAIRDSIAEVAIAGAIVDRATVSKVAKKTLDQRAKDRSQMIGQTETQNIAEKSKDVEATVLATGVAAAALSITKVWNAVLDGKTRIAHAFADGQEVGVGQAFNVDGERLKFPGDTSLGASAGNTINCRCSVNYSTS